MKRSTKRTLVVNGRIMWSCDLINLMGKNVFLDNSAFGSMSEDSKSTM